jgi:uncharacterized membrane protein
MAFLLDDFVVWLGTKVKDMAEDELYGSKEKIHENLIALQAKLDMGELTEEEYAKREEELLAQLQLLDDKMKK